ncbi:hypothetical protein [Alteromonas facilis]|uniref:hypothetical protein n=1 Tax=Alteromonas facilis TaxID=2048004 RepID=UPI000C283635|nr:hypothetical protein [Alteromonas facilis]
MFPFSQRARAIAILSLALVLPLKSVATEQTNTSSNKLEHNETSYFRHIMFRETPYAPYRGIYPLDESTPPNAAHYQFKQDRQGRITQITYQQKDALIRGNEVWDSFIWFAPRVDIAYEGNTETHTYYDSDGNRIAAHGNVYTAIYELNNNNQRVALRFYDQQGNASESEWNIHRYEWRHANGKVYEKRLNLNDEQQPLRPVFTFYEVELEYDRDGKLVFVRNLGLTGEPTNNESGAGIDRITYDHNGNFSRWQVYDKDGKPVEGNRPMVHLGEHLYDANGNKVGMRGFDRYGKQITFSWGIYEHVRAFNQYGNMVEHAMYNADGSLSRHLLIEYNQAQTEITWLKSIDEQRQLVNSPMLGGAAALQYEYSTDGNVVRRPFNADMSEFNPPQQDTSE